MSIINAINSSYPFAAADGGTGRSSLTAHGIVLGQGLAAVNSVVLGDGQLLIGIAGADPVAANITAGAGIAITNASGQITIANTGMNNWTDATSTAVPLAINSSYIADNGSQVVFTLPATAPLGAEFEIVGKGAGGWKIAQLAGQTVYGGNKSTTTGTGGSLSSGYQRDCVRLVCVTANTDFQVMNVQGNLTAV